MIRIPQGSQPSSVAVGVAYPSNWKSLNSLCQPLPLSRAVGLLAEGIQRSMIALYALQTALINTLARHRGSKSLLEEIQRIRKLFRDEWEKVIVLVQHFYGYSDDYISLCEYAMTQESTPDGWAYFKDVTAVSQDVLSETRGLRTRHDRLNRELGKQRNRLKSALTSSTWFATEGPKAGGTLNLMFQSACPTTYS
jgi:hypothetical protein